MIQSPFELKGITHTNCSHLFVWQLHSDTIKTKHYRVVCNSYKPIFWSRAADFEEGFQNGIKSIHSFMSQSLTRNQYLMFNFMLHQPNELILYELLWITLIEIEGVSGFHNFKTIISIIKHFTLASGKHFNCNSIL